MLFLQATFNLNAVLAKVFYKPSVNKYNIVKERINNKVKTK
jgi:hypothetical protein